MRVRLYSHLSLVINLRELSQGEPVLSLVVVQGIYTRPEVGFTVT